jgi:hypothetical protein
MEKLKVTDQEILTKIRDHLEIKPLEHELESMEDQMAMYKY